MNGRSLINSVIYCRNCDFFRESDRNLSSNNKYSNNMQGNEEKNVK